jgi:uncharacterized RDD family membrane protein YckC
MRTGEVAMLSRIADGQNGEGSMNGDRKLWQRRVAAALLDAIPIIVAVQGAFLALGYGVVFFHSAGSVGYIHLGLIEILAIAVYYPWTMVISDGRTLGKFVMGIRVIRTDNEPMNFMRAGWREVIVKSILFGTLMILSGVAGALGVIVVTVDVLWPLGDGENRALHDVIAGTRVVMVGDAAKKGQRGTVDLDASPSGFS